MRTQSSLSFKTNITNKDIEHILNLRSTYDAQKKRLEMAENALTEAENEIMAKINAGVAVITPYEIQIKIVERKNVAWKSICSELIGAKATEDILDKTKPSITYRLLIKAA